MKKLSVLPIGLAFILMILYTQCTWDIFVYEPEPVENVSFSMDIIPIFDASCNTSGCHNTGGTAPDLTAGNAYDELQNGGYIDIDSPADSELYQWMTGNRSIPMPLSGPDAEYNAKVLQWIEEGALDN